MRLAKLVRFCLLCVLAVALWLRPNLVRAQYGGDCSAYGYDNVNCVDESGNQCCSISPDVPEYNGDYEGSGQETTDYETVTCTPLSGDSKSCCSSFSTLVVVTNPGCDSCRPYGAPCSSDFDCCDDLSCSSVGYCGE